MEERIDMMRMMMVGGDAAKLPMKCAVTGQEMEMKRWFGRMLEAMRSWMKSNAKSHAEAKAQGCCSAPPPGAGRDTRHPGNRS
ncbi:MAG: hypothetical protein KDH17_19075 [Rhodocyclaceae bacterium]|nr:hypothetical protein [Rhodocyclaceae bacterium]